MASKKDRKSSHASEAASETADLPDFMQAALQTADIPDQRRNHLKLDSPAAAIAHAVLIEAIPRSIRSAIEKDDPIVVLLETRSAAWTAALQEHVDRLWPDATVQAPRQAPTKHSQPHTPNVSGSVIAITQNAGWLTSAVVAGADARISVRATPSIVARAIKFVCGRRPTVTDTDISGLDLPDFVMAIRRKSSAVSSVRNLRRAVAARAVVSSDDKTPTLELLAGYGAALEKVKEVAAAVTLRQSAPLSREPIPSVLLYGPPGTGKTTLVRSFARTLSLPIVVTSVASWFSTTDGTLGDVTAAAQRFFDEAKASAPSVALLDELDAVPNRATLPPDRAEWWSTMVTGVLLGIDDIRRRAPDVVMFGATNHRERLDAALCRPGRFDLHIEILPPATVEETAGVLRQHLGHDLAGIDLRPAAELAFGATGAAIEAWVRTARRAATTARRPVSISDLLAAIAPPDLRPQQEVLATALHEAAHAVVALEFGIPVRSISVVETETSAGRTEVAPLEGVYSREELERRVIALLAGRAADEAMCAGATSGAAGDLAQATRIIAAIHCAFGLGDTLVARSAYDEAGALVKFDPELKELVAVELRRLMSEARSLVVRREDPIRRLATALVARRVLLAAEIQELLLTTKRSNAKRRRAEAKPN